MKPPGTNKLTYLETTEERLAKRLHHHGLFVLGHIEGITRPEI